MSSQNVIQQQFGSQKAFEKFLKQNGFTQEDARDRIRLQLISQAIQDAVIPQNIDIPADQIQEYYDANKSQFETRRRATCASMLTKTESEAAQAKAELEKDSEPEGLAEGREEVLDGQATKNSGGLRQRLIQGQSEPTLDQEVFAAAEGELVGPFKGQSGFYVIQVEKITPATTTPLECPADDKSCTPASEQIKQTLVAAKQNSSPRLPGGLHRQVARAHVLRGRLRDRSLRELRRGRRAPAPRRSRRSTGCPAPVASRPIVPPGQRPALVGVTAADPARAGTGLPGSAGERDAAVGSPRACRPASPPRLAGHRASGWR